MGGPGSGRKKGSKGSKPRTRLPCGCFASARGASNDYNGARHSPKCPLSGTKGPTSEAALIRVKDRKTLALAQRRARRSWNVRIRKVAAFNWDALHLVSTDAAQGMKTATGRPFMFVRLNGTCEVCNDPTADYVNALTMNEAICDQCLTLYLTVGGAI